MTDVLKDAVLAQYKYFVSAEEEMILLKDYKDEEDEEDVRIQFLLFFIFIKDNSPRFEV